VVDDFTRECLGLVRDTSLSGARVARELDKIAAIRGKKLAAGLQYHPAAFETGRAHPRRDRRSTGMGACPIPVAITSTISHQSRGISV
jgi:transposase InsO family protein